MGACVGFVGACVGFVGACVRACVGACVGACVRACVRACGRACGRAPLGLWRPADLSACGGVRTGDLQLTNSQVSQ